MIFGYINRKRRNREIVDAIYREITAAARNPVYFERMNVPDTVMGRFEMISIMMVLFLRRTKDASPAIQDLARDVVDAFFAEIDHSIRELGVGDNSVPKRMKKLARMFYGRLDSYASALDDGDTAALATALKRNIHPQQETANMDELAEAMARLDGTIAGLPEEEILTGRLSFAQA